MISSPVAAALTELERALLESEDAPPRVRESFVRFLYALEEWPHDERVLVAPAHGDWVRMPSGKRIDLGGRRLFKRIVQAFVDCHLDSPGRALGPDDLLQVGWPGQTVRSASASNRLHVALSRLRSLGFEEVLIRRPEGWALSPWVRIERETKPQLAASEPSERAPSHSDIRELAAPDLASEPLLRHA